MHKTTTSRLILILMITMLIMPAISITPTVTAADPKEHKIMDKGQDKKTERLSTLIGSVQYTMDWKYTGVWTDKTSDLKVTHKSDNLYSKKFTFDVDAKENTQYKIKLTIPFKVKNYTQIDTRFFIYYDDWSMIYDYKDIVNVSGLVFNSGLDGSNYFWFTAETTIAIPKDTKVSLDPIYTITSTAGGARTNDFCPGQNKIVRFSNGTLFCTYFMSSIQVARSIDNGVTWVNNWFVRGEAAYDSTVVVTYDAVHGDILHLLFARTVGASTGTEYMNFSALNISQTHSGWSSIYNVTAVGTQSEEISVGVNSSGALYCFWYQGGGGTIYNRTYYKNAWSVTRSVALGSGACFPTCTVDYKDVVHVVACGTGGGNDEIFYYNITNGAFGTTIIVYDGDLNDQGYPNIFNDESNNLYVTWLGSIGAIYEIRERTYYFANRTWNVGVRNLSGHWTDGEYSGCEGTVLTNNTVLFTWTIPKNNATKGNWYMRRTSAGAWSPKINFYSSAVSSNCFTLYQSYPKINVAGTYVYTNRPTTGFSEIIWVDADNDLFYFNMSANYSGVTVQKASTFTPYNVEKTTATLKGSILYTAVSGAVCGFLIDTTSPTFSSYDFNVTSSGTFDYGDFFYYNITGLTKATYYYVKAWIKNGTDSIMLCNETYMLMKPDEPVNIEVIGTSYASIALRWLNPGVPASIDTYKAVCRYSLSGYPGSPTTGSSGFNVSQSKTASYGYGNVSGLTGGKTYYMAVWLYIEDSGSPTIIKFSSYVLSLAITPGGQYNISFRYENSSYHPVDFSKVGGVFNVTKTSVARNRDNLGQYLSADIPISYWGTTSDPQWVYTPTFSPNTSSLPAIYAYNTTVYDWVLVKQYGYANGTYCSVGGKAGWYRIERGTVHGDVHWTAFKVYYPSYLYSNGHTYINVTSAYNDTSVCQLEAFNLDVNSWIVLQPTGTCNGTFMSNSTYRVKKGTTHGGYTSFRLTYQSRESSARCQLLVRYANRTEYNTFGYTNGIGTGLRSIQSNGDFNKTSKSYVLLNLSYTPLWFEFFWNDTRDPYRCYRMRVTEPATHNYTFYISTNKQVYDELSTTFVNHLVEYNIQLTDTTGLIALPPGNFSVYAYLYTFDDAGNRLIIHSEYCDALSQFYPMLLYGRNYFIGIASSHYIFDAFSQFMCTDATDQSLNIVNSNNTPRIAAMSMKSGWVNTAGGIWCNYIDGNHNVISSWFKIYDYNNDTLGNLLYGDSSNSYSENYTYAAANHSRNYLVNLRVNMTNGVSLFFNFTMYKNDTSMRRYNGSHVNALMNLTFGFSPFRQIDNPDIYIPWIDVLVFIISVFLICSFPGQSAGLCGIVVGSVDVFIGLFVSGVSVTLIGAGVVIVFFSFLYLWGGKK